MDPRITELIKERDDLSEKKGALAAGKIAIKLIEQYKAEENWSAVAALLKFCDELRGLL